MPRPGRAASAAALLCCLAGGLAGCSSQVSLRPSRLDGTRAPGASVGPTTPGATVTGPTTTMSTADVTLGGATRITAPTSAARATTTAVTVAVAASTLAGFQRAADPEGTVSVAVPSGWTLVPLDDKTLEALANQSAAFPAETRQQLQNAVAQAGQYMKVLAVGPPAASGDSPTLNAIVTPGAPPLTTLKTVYPQQVAAIGATLVSQSDVVVDGRPALRVSLKLPAGGRDLVSTQIIVPADGRTVIVSIANADPALLEQLVAAIVIPRR